MDELSAKRAVLLTAMHEEIDAKKTLEEAKAKHAVADSVPDMFNLISNAEVTVLGQYSAAAQAHEEGCEAMINGLSTKTNQAKTDSEQKLADIKSALDGASDELKNSAASHALDGLVERYSTQLSNLVLAADNWCENVRAKMEQVEELVRQNVDARNTEKEELVDALTNSDVDQLTQTFENASEQVTQKMSELSGPMINSERDFGPMS